MVSTESPVRVYRLIKERFLSTPLSTEGARRLGGRWNPPGIGVLYASASPELALLEQMVHLRSLPYSDLPRLVLLTLALPEPPRLLGVTELPENWRDESDFSENRKLIAPWLTRPDVLTLGVPSAVVPDSFNFLIHPLHPSFEGVTVERTSAFSVDARLWHEPGELAK
ncbi:RES family NAD+ phosphorylase [Spirosoma luteum]|uniref:RES family NAD+ phosphorylase n=1 Tax=Spirosoma luteum TaxID=431553 RepID=UPI0003612386|nr:RES family NAD+ phosphorylase [Spirosoma luteum]